MKYTLCFIMIYAFSAIDSHGQQNCSCGEQTYEYFREEFDGPTVDPVIWAGDNYSWIRQLDQGSVVGLDYLVNPGQTHIAKNPLPGEWQTQYVPMIPDWSANYGFEYDQQLNSNKLVLKTIHDPITARTIDWKSDTDTIFSKRDTILNQWIPPVPTYDHPAVGPNRRTYEYRSAGLNSLWYFGYGIYRWRVRMTGVSIFPNPSTGIFNLRFTSVNTRHMVVSDVSGKSLLTLSTELQNVLIDLGPFSKGVFILSISSENGLSTHKLITQ